MFYIWQSTGEMVAFCSKREVYLLNKYKTSVLLPGILAAKSVLSRYAAVQ